MNDSFFLDDVLPIVAVLIVVVLVIGTVSIPFNLQECALYDGTDIPHKMLLFGGCKIQRPNGIWVNPDDYFMLEQLGGSK